MSDFLETGAIVDAHLTVCFLHLGSLRHTRLYENYCRCLQEAAVETLCKTGRHVGVQIDSIRRFCRLTTPSARGQLPGTVRNVHDLKNDVCLALKLSG